MQPNVVLRWRAIRPALCLLFGFLLVAVSGCETSSRPQPAETKPLAGRADHHGYALLANLAGDEKDVSKLRFIKRERLELKTLTQEIAATNRRLESFDSLSSARSSSTVEGRTARTRHPAGTTSAASFAS